jgi:uncharacterized protein (DUF2141 family)
MDASGLSFLSTVVATLLLGRPARAATIIATLDGVRSDESISRPLLQTQGLPGAGSFERHAKVKAHKGSSTVVFDHVATGTYAVGACHDETRRTARHGFLGLSRRGDIDY